MGFSELPLSSIFIQICVTLLLVNLHYLTIDLFPILYFPTIPVTFVLFILLDFPTCHNFGCWWTRWFQWSDGQVLITGTYLFLFLSHYQWFFLNRCFILIQHSSIQRISKVWQRILIGQLNIAQYSGRDVNIQKVKREKYFSNSKYFSVTYLDCQPFNW